LSFDTLGREWDRVTSRSARSLEVIADHRLYALFAVGVAAGMRKGELLALRWSDVDLELGIVHERRNV
jgi:integrase